MKNPLSFYGGNGFIGSLSVLADTPNHEAFVRATHEPTVGFVEDYAENPSCWVAVEDGQLPGNGVL